MNKKQQQEDEEQHKSQSTTSNSTKTEIIIQPQNPGRVTTNERSRNITALVEFWEKTGSSNSLASSYRTAGTNGISSNSLLSSSDHKVNIGHGGKGVKHIKPSYSPSAVKRNTSNAPKFHQIKAANKTASDDFIVAASRRLSETSAKSSTSSSVNIDYSQTSNKVKQTSYSSSQISTNTASLPSLKASTTVESVSLSLESDETAMILGESLLGSRDLNRMALSVEVSDRMP